MDTNSPKTHAFYVYLVICLLIYGDLTFNQLIDNYLHVYQQGNRIMSEKELSEFLLFNRNSGSTFVKFHFLQCTPFHMNAKELKYYFFLFCQFKNSITFNFDKWTCSIICQERLISDSDKCSIIKYFNFTFLICLFSCDISCVKRHYLYNSRLLLKIENLIWYTKNSAIWLSNSVITFKTLE